MRPGPISGPGRPFYSQPDGWERFFLLNAKNNSRRLAYIGQRYCMSMTARERDIPKRRTR